MFPASALRWCFALALLPAGPAWATFTDIGAALPGVSGCAVAWVDFDNDGDLDVTFAGDSGAGAIARIYRNTAGSFVDAGAAINGLTHCAMAWGDYDNDGDSDFAICGLSGTTTRVTSLYRNTAGAFTVMLSGLPGVYRGSLSFGDYDSDGDLDLTISGASSTVLIARVYRNASGAFSNTGFILQGIQFGATVWGDADNDGDLDIANGRADRFDRLCGGLRQQRHRDE